MRPPRPRVHRQASPRRSRATGWRFFLLPPRPRSPAGPMLLPRPRPARHPNLLALQADDQGHQEDAKIGHGHRESFRRRWHPIAAKEGAPLSGPCFRELIAQANRNIGRSVSSASFEGPLSSLDKRGSAKLERSGNYSKIIEILESAIGHAKRDQRLEFLRNNRFDGVGLKMRRRSIHQDRIIDLDSRGYNGVTRSAHCARNARADPACTGGSGAPRAVLPSRRRDRPWSR